LGLTEKIGRDTAKTLSSVLFRDLTPKQFFQYFASINPFYFVAAGVDKQVRGWEHSSDHAPVWVELTKKMKKMRQNCYIFDELCRLEMSYLGYINLRHAFTYHQGT